MKGKQNRDALYFCCIFEVRGEGSVQKRTGVYSMGWKGGSVMECEYIRSLFIFLPFFFAWKCADFTNT